MKNTRSQKSNTSRKAARQLVPISVDLTASNAAFLRNRCKELGVSKELVVSHAMVDELIREKTGKMPLLLDPKDIDLICESICFSLSCDTDENGSIAESAAAWRELSPSYVETVLRKRRVSSLTEAEAIRAENDRRADLLDYFSRFMPNQTADAKEVVHV